ncbi:MAG: efflux RND transporter periplasmic adaptor subunit [Flavobacteriales bacterium]
MKTIFRIIGILFVILIFGGTIYYLYSNSQEKTVKYETKEPYYTDIIRKTVATGSIVPRKEIDIKPQVSGIISKLYVKAGENLKEGDILAKIKIVPDMAALNNAENRLDQAKIDFENQKQAFERNKKLYQDSVIPEAEFQNIKSSYEQAKEELKAAENNLQIIKKGAAKKSAENSNTLVRATASGTVLEVPVEEGNSVIESNNFNEGTSIAVIADLTNMLFEGKVDEAEVGKLHEGMDLILHIGAIQNKTFKGKLEYISPKGEEEDGAIKFDIEASVKLQEDQFIRAGYSSTADIVLERKDSVLAIKESLLQFNKKDQPYVEVETAPQKFEKREVELGISNGIDVEVLSGISGRGKL